MKTLEDEIRHILDYDSEETVALTFKTKARLVKNIVSTVEDFYASQSQPTDEDIDAFYPIKNEYTALTMQFIDRNKARREGAKALRDGKMTK